MPAALLLRHRAPFLLRDVLAQGHHHHVVVPDQCVPQLDQYLLRHPVLLRLWPGEVGHQDDHLAAQCLVVPVEGVPSSGRGKQQEHEYCQGEPAPAGVSQDAPFGDNGAGHAPPSHVARQEHQRQPAQRGRHPGNGGLIAAPEFEELDDGGHSARNSDHNTKEYLDQFQVLLQPGQRALHP